MLTNGIVKDPERIRQKRGVHYICDDRGRPVKYKPWLGDLFCFLYDRIMEKSVFPKKFKASIEEHYRILQQLLGSLSGKRVVEFACGSGDAVKFLGNTNIYAGLDISAGLLHIARNKFDRHGFLQYRLYCADAGDTPFRDDSFDVAICNLSLNFFQDVGLFIAEVQRVLQPGGILCCSTPVPERKHGGSVIHGELFTLNKLKEMFAGRNFRLKVLPHENGALLYFWAVLEPVAP